MLTGFDAGAQVADAIRRNVLLGSSAIGIAAAFGLAVGARKIEDMGFEEVLRLRPFAIVLFATSKFCTRLVPQRL